MCLGHKKCVFKTHFYGLNTFWWSSWWWSSSQWWSASLSVTDPLHHPPKLTEMKRRCNILQHTATYCNTLHHPPECTEMRRHCNILQHTQHTATHCNTMQHTASSPESYWNDWRNHAWHSGEFDANYLAEIAAGKMYLLWKASTSSTYRSDWRNCQTHR